MTGIIDVGGGMRGIYTSGVYDYLMDKNISVEYCLGVSAGSANLITYLAGQRGRTKRFYLDYSFDEDYMGFNSFVNKGTLINLDYIYSEISNSTGKDPLDIEAVRNCETIFKALSTDALTGERRCFSKSDFKNDDYYALKASCALPLACRPVEIENRVYFDGGVADPIPYKIAFEDGCERVIVCLTKPVSYVKRALPGFAKLVFKKYPETASALLKMHEKYNTAVVELLELEKQGKVLIVAPETTCGVGTVRRNKENLLSLYNLGYADGVKIESYLKK